MAEIVVAADATGNHFCPCYANRLMATTAEVARLLQGGAIGDVWSFNCQWMTSQVALRGPDNWLFHRQYSAGGILTWLACHWIDLLRVVLRAEVTAVAAMVATQCREDIDVEDTASLILRFDQGAIGTVRAGYALNPFPGYEDTDLYLQFEGSQGALTWFVRGSSAGYLLRSSSPDHAGVRRVEAPPPAAGTGQGYSADFWEAFVTAHRTGQKPPATAHDALAVLRIIEAAYQSSAEGRTVSL
jgi:predicted dehydrogenase